MLKEALSYNKFAVLIEKYQKEHHFHLTLSIIRYLAPFVGNGTKVKITSQRKIDRCNGIPTFTSSCMVQTNNMAI